MLTWTVGNGALVQISIKSIKAIGNVLINVQSRFVRLTVVAVEKQFVLFILIGCL
jgi:hypothetical protein